MVIHMDTNHLKSFLAVAELASFSEAAEKLFLTQPAISKRIAALEEQLHCKLFNRIGRHISLTQEGERLLPRAREILISVEQTERDIREGTDSISGNLEIMTSHHVGLHRLPPVLKTFVNEYPDVTLNVQFVDSEFAHQSVLHGETELAVVTLAPLPEENIVSKRIWHDPLVFVCPTDHPLCSKDSLTLEDLSTHHAVLPGLNTYTGKLVAELFQRQHLRLDTRSTSSNYLETIKMLISIGMGWSVLPASMVDNSLHILTIDDHRPARDLGLIFHRKRHLSKAARAFVDALLKEC